MKVRAREVIGIKFKPEDESLIGNFATSRKQEEAGHYILPRMHSVIV